MIRHPPRSPLFPSTPLSRSGRRFPVPPGKPRLLRHRHLGVPPVPGGGLLSAPLSLLVDPRGEHSGVGVLGHPEGDRKSTRLNSSHANISYAVFCLKKKKNT